MISIKLFFYVLCILFAINGFCFVDTSTKYRQLTSALNFIEANKLTGKMVQQIGFMILYGIILLSFIFAGDFKFV